MKEEKKTETRRSAIKKMAAGVPALLTVGAGTAAGQTGHSQRDISQDNSNGNNIGSGDGPGMTPQWMKDVDCSLSPYRISSGETSKLSAVWHTDSLLPGNTYQFDILVQTGEVKQPDLVATDIKDKYIDKEWEYKDQSPIGPAWHFKASLVSVSDYFGASFEVDSILEAYDTGETQVRAGSFWPYQQWVRASLNVD